MLLLVTPNQPSIKKLGYWSNFCIIYNFLATFLKKFNFILRNPKLRLNI